MKVKNLKGTADKSCKCESWLDHWRRFTGKAGRICAVVGCKETNVVGAHVMKVGSTDKDHYIVPLCNVHNQSDRELEINDGMPPVSANVQKTCAR